MLPPSFLHTCLLAEHGKPKSPWLKCYLATTKPSGCYQQYSHTKSKTHTVPATKRVNSVPAETRTLSMCLLLWFFFRCRKRLGGAKPHADERSEKVRRLLAGSVSNSKVLHGNSVKHFSLVSQAPCRQPLELDEHLR